MRQILGALIVTLALVVVLAASAAPASADRSYTGGHFGLDLDG